MTLRQVTRLLAMFWLGLGFLPGPVLFAMALPALVLFQWIVLFGIAEIIKEAG